MAEIIIPLAELWDQADRDRQSATIWATHARTELVKAKASGDAEATDLWRSALHTLRRRALRYADIQRLIGAAESSTTIQAEIERLARAEKAAIAETEGGDNGED